MTAAHRRPLLLSLAAVSYGAVFALFCVGERPGLGLGHFYYVPVALIAMCSGPAFGALAGVGATLLYTLGIFVNPSIPSTLQLAETGIRLCTFTVVGVLIGAYARANRQLVGELSQLAERDTL